MKKVFVSILHYGAKENTLECLKSLKILSTTSYQLLTIVVDNASPEPLNVEEKEFKDINLKIIKNKVNLGFAGGHNVVVSESIRQGVDYILILNNDTIVDKNLIEELLKIDQKGVGIIAPKIYFAPGFEFHRDRYKENERGKVIWYAGGVIDWDNVIAKHRGVDEVDSGQFDKAQETNFASGACMLVKREVFEKVGLLDGKYFLYYEDSDLCMRVKRAGYKIMLAPKAILWHKNAGAAGGSGSPLQDYYITRNRLLFGIRYAPIRAKLSLIRESFRLLISGREWQKRGVVDFYLGRFGKGSYRI